MKEVLQEIHLYVDKGELLVKDTIWAISWLGGIYAISNTEDKRALASAYLIFALSLLMEFGLKIKDKKKYISRIIDGIFCMAVVSILLMAIIALFGAPLFTAHYDIMYKISIGIMVFMAIDFGVVWIAPEYLETQSINENVSNQVNEEINIFREKLLNGNLGSIAKGDKKNG